MATAIGNHKTKVLNRTIDGRCYTVVKYHDTEVAIVGADSILLDSGGHRTKTTKLRMNQVSEVLGIGYRVYQKDYEWFVDHRGETLRFSDAMVFTR